MSFCVNVNQYFYISYTFMIQLFLLLNINFSETCHCYTSMYKDDITVERCNAICYEQNLSILHTIMSQINVVTRRKFQRVTIKFVATHRSNYIGTTTERLYSPKSTDMIEQSPKTWLTIENEEYIEKPRS